MNKLSGGGKDEERTIQALLKKSISKSCKASAKTDGMMRDAEASSEGDGEKSPEGSVVATPPGSDDGEKSEGSMPFTPDLSEDSDVETAPPASLLVVLVEGGGSSSGSHSIGEAGVGVGVHSGSSASVGYTSSGGGPDAGSGGYPSGVEGGSGGLAGPGFGYDAGGPAITVDVPGGELSFYRGRQVMIAQCRRLGHTSECKRERTVRPGRRPGQGRPVGFLLAWLASGEHEVDKAGHLSHKHFEHAERADCRRDFLDGGAEAQELASHERAPVEGEGQEPLDFA